MGEFQQPASTAPCPHVGALAGSRAVPDLHHLAGRRIEEALAGEEKVPAGRSVEGATLVAAVAEKEPDQNERKEDAEGEQERKKMDHGTGSTTAAVP